MTSQLAVLRTELVVMSTAGPFSYPVPSWCDRLDIVMLSGGDGGNVGTPQVPGAGGWAGKWTAITVNRGDAAWKDLVTGVVGSGGTHGTVQQGPSGGTASTVNVQLPGMQFGAMASMTSAGDSPGNINYNGRSYLGGRPQENYGQEGFAPGGGGAGVTAPHTAAGRGAPGAVWFYAQQEAPRAAAVYRRLPRPEARGAFPTQQPELTEYARPGLYDFIIPYWCTAIDVITLSGGAGGDGGGTNSHNPGTNGKGGAQGKWDMRTLVRGRDLSWWTRSIRVSVGEGGVGGIPGGNGTDGGESFGGYESMDVLSSGGVGNRAHRLAADILPPLSVDFHNAALGLAPGLFTAGVHQATPGLVGHGPGGGGGGGMPDQPGGDGAPGKVWIVAYQAAGCVTGSYRGLSHPCSSPGVYVNYVARYRGRIVLKCVVRTGLPLILDHGLLNQTPVGVLDGGAPSSVAPVVVSGGNP